MYSQAIDGGARQPGAQIRRRIRIKIFGARALLLFALAGFSTISAVRAAPAAPTFTSLPPTFTVNSISDIVAAAPLDDGICATAYTNVQPNGECTVRAAVMEANHWAGGGATIVFAPQLSGATLSLAIPLSGPDDETTGDLNLTANVTLNGSGATQTIIDGNGGITNDRVFSIAGGVVVTMTGVTIQGGRVANDGGGLYNAGYLALDSSQVISNTSVVPPDGGGGLNNQGVLTVTNSLIQGNTVTFGRGGGIDTGIGSSVRLMNSTIAGNHADNAGGGIVNGAATLIVYSSTVSNNTTFFDGGGILAISGNTTLVNTTINTNTAGTVGGGLDNSGGTAALVNSTVSGNRAKGDGGGIWNGCGCPSVTDLFNATVAGNQADAPDADGNGTGGGIFNSSFAGNFVHFQNSLVAGNYATSFNGFVYVLSPEDCFGSLTSQDYNLISVTAGCTLLGGPHDQKDIPANLGPLQNNGGPTWTQALLPGSTAIDAGNPVACTDNLGATLATDQRGWPRTANGAGATRCDIGAYEVQLLANRVNLPLVVR